MVKIHCRTNLDLCHCEKWPEELPEVPRVGDLIESSHEWKSEGRSIGLKIELVVVQVSWKCRTLEYGKPCKPNWYPEVELHLPPHRFESIRDFYNWYGKLCGRGAAAFI